jgi:hypothetical protein
MDYIKMIHDQKSQIIDLNVQLNSTQASREREHDKLEMLIIKTQDLEVILLYELNVYNKEVINSLWMLFAQIDNKKLQKRIKDIEKNNLNIIDMCNKKSWEMNKKSSIIDKLQVNRIP